MTRRGPFRDLTTSLDIIPLAAMLHIRFPPSLRNVEDLLQERGIEVRHGTLRCLWRQIGPTFAAEWRGHRAG